MTKVDQLINSLKETSCSGKMVIPLNMSGEKLLKAEIVKIIIEEAARASEIGFQTWLNNING